MAKPSKKLSAAVAAELRTIDVHDEKIQTFFNLEGDQCLILINAETELRSPAEARIVYRDGGVLKARVGSWEVTR